MKRLQLVIVAAALAASSAAHAQIVGQFTGAETVPNSEHFFGGYVYSSENVLGLHGQLRMSFYPNVDFGFNGGFARLDFASGNRTILKLGTGLKVKLSDSTGTVPVTVAIAGDLGLETGDDYHVVTIEPSLIASRSFGVGTSAVTPYGRIGLAIGNFDFGDRTDTDLSVPLRVGAELSLAQQIRVVGELQINLSDQYNDDVGFGLGVNFPF